MSSVRRHTIAGVSVVGICGLLAITAACASGSSEEPTLDYGAAAVLARNGESVNIQPTISGAAVGFAVAPPLPAGLVLNPTTGAIVGIPVETRAQLEYTVGALMNGDLVTDTVELAVGAALPDSVASLVDGFECQSVATIASGTAKMALTPDGRVLITEFMTGAIRIVDASGDLLPTPFATVPVLGGGHLGLLGIAVSPDFTTNGHVFAYACTPAGSGKPDRGRLLRWTAVGDVGTAQTVLLDDVPVAAINNGGAICFDSAGMLLLSIGDTQDPALAQDEASLAGKILRIDPDDGGIPTDNPDPGSYVFAKGLRNVFALTLNPDVGALFMADNGPDNDDELNLLQAGRNYEWGASVGASFGADTGAVLRTWSDVVVPTGLAFQHDAPAWSGAFGDSLYLALYDEQVIRRFEMSGDLRTDIDGEHEFLRFEVSGTDHLPVDVQRGPSGSLWVLTFRGLYRVDPID